jgi:hypothetical protein
MGRVAQRGAKVQAGKGFDLRHRRGEARGFGGDGVRLRQQRDLIEVERGDLEPAVRPVRGDDFPKGLRQAEVLAQAQSADDIASYEK